MKATLYGVAVFEEVPIADQADAVHRARAQESFKNAQVDWAIQGTLKLPCSRALEVNADEAACSVAQAPARQAASNRAHKLKLSAREE